MNRRSLISIALIIGFSAIAVFGAFAMGQSAGEQNACIAATANGLDCITPSNLVSIASLYIGTFGTFSSALFSTLSLLILFVTALLVLEYLGLSRTALQAVVRLSDITRSDSKRQHIRWASLHENSPSQK